MSASKKVAESYTKKMTSLKGQTEETGMQRLIRERTQAAIARASAKTQADVVKSLAALKVQTTAALDSISSSLSSEISTLKDVQEAIRAEEANLKSLHDITAEANSLQALVLAHEEEREKFNLEMVQSRHSFDQEKADRAKQRARDEEQYQYDTNKRHKEEEDRVQEQRLQAQQAFQATLDTKSADLQAREELVSEQETEFKSLKEQVVKFDETLKKEVDRSVAIATNSLKKDLTHEHTIKTLEFQNTIKLKETEITQLNTRIAELIKQNQQLDQEYKAASTKVQQIAEKAIDGAARQQTVVQVPGTDADSKRRQ